MGASASRRESSTPQPTCWFCAASLARTIKYRRIRCCRRCGAVAESRVESEKRITLEWLQFRPFAESLPVEDHESNTLLAKYILPYFVQHPDKVICQGDTLQINGVDWKVALCYPPSGTVSVETSMEVDNAPIATSQELIRFTVTACLETVPPGQQTDQAVLESLLMPYFTSEERIVCEEDFFVVSGVQFKVTRCQPASGRVTSSTRLFVESRPAPDIAKMHVLPVYESLPNREKNITEDEVFQKYLKGYFTASFRHISKGQEFDHKGVTFKVVGLEPESGVVTTGTHVHTSGEPLQFDEIRQQQMIDDEELARRLQFEESVHGGYRHSAPVTNVINIRHLRNGPQSFDPRLEELLAQLPSDNQLRPIIVNLHRRQARDGQRQILNGPVFLESLLQSLSAEQDAPTGADPSRVTQLPTRRFTAPALKSPAQTSDDEQTTCRVCLSEYEDQDMLRTLPCFHVFHSECVDRWLSINSSCPICKNPIS
uniref:RING-type domain-containing protein n=1 Tax=Spongospora subterranea TaxID=70186 RepID=A0A0H5R888_9EUKA|eukprot:CRZ09922.1 hypothetical protein [Spongospora subterranea]